MSEMRNRIWELYHFLAKICNLGNDLELGKHPVNTPLLLQLLAGILGEGVVIYGEPGTGKTSTACLVASILSGIPFSFYQAFQLRCNPELTLEHMLGRPHLGALSRGEEEVVWSYWAKAPVKVVDELPRMPPGKQNMLLQGLEIGIWTYLNQNISTGRDTPVYATANYPDPGSYEVVPPLLDRFSVGVELGYPGALRAVAVADGDTIQEKAQRWGLDEYWHEAVEAASKPNQEGHQALLELAERKIKPFREAKDLPVLYRREIEAIRREIVRKPFSKAAAVFREYLVSRMSFCENFKQKRSNESCPRGCEYFDSTCSWVTAAPSARVNRHIRVYAQALTWLRGSRWVLPEDIARVAPFCIWHRVRFNRHAIEAVKGEKRADPLLLHLSRKLVNALKDEFEEEKAFLLELRKARTGSVNPKEVKNLYYRDLLRYR